MAVPFANVAGEFCLVTVHVLVEYVLGRRRVAPVANARRPRVRDHGCGEDKWSTHGVIAKE